MKNKFTPFILLAFILSLVTTGCDGSSSTSNAPETSIETDNQSETKQQEETSIDGVYTGSKNVSGLELTAELTVNGNRWSAISQLGSASPEYNSGVVRGSDLYDEYGSTQIGYISGKNASINGFPSMRK